MTKSFRDFLAESPELDTSLPDHNKARHFDNNPTDFANFEHISTLPSGHRLFKERDVPMDSMSEPHFWFVAHPKLKRKEMTMITYRDPRRVHSLSFVGVNKDAGSELDHSDVYHHMAAHHGLRIASLNKHSEEDKETWKKLKGRPGTSLSMMDKNGTRVPLERKFDSNYSAKHKGKRFLLTKNDD